MKKRRNRFAKWIQEWGPYVAVFAVFAVFVAFVTWDVQRQRDAGRAVGLTDGRFGVAETGREGIPDAEPEEQTLAEAAEEQRQLREQEAADAETRERLRYDQARTYRVEVLVEGLSSPDGLAVDPETGCFYVTEEDRAVIWRVDDSGRTAVVTQDTPLTRPGTNARQPPPRGLEGLALDGSAALYAAEDVPGGRLLRFPLNEEGGVHAGEVIPIPGHWQDFAWEAVAVAGDGRLLFGGSNVERALQADGSGLFVGVILYRDSQGQWWIPYERLFGSISGVAFSKTGEQAVYVCEVSGEVGWIDLRSPRPAGGTSRWTARMPEDIAVLPNGSLLVAEEHGRISILDPGTDHLQTLADSFRGLESVRWDPHGERILAVDDATGHVVALYVEPGFDAEDDRMAYAPYEPLYNLVHVPQRCPDYLEEVLALGGFRSQAFHSIPLTFREFTQRVPLVAAELYAEPISVAPSTDPLRYLQFVVFEPNRILNAELGPSTTLAAFYARTRDGAVIRTSTLRTLSSIASFPDFEFERLGAADLVIPNAAAVTVSAAGIATLHFLGFGRTPDFSITMDPLQPDNSRMLVQNIDGSIESYQLRVPGPASDPRRWVVAYARELADEWKRLGDGTARVAYALGGDRP